MATHFVLNTGAKIPLVGLVGDAVYAAVKVSPSLILDILVLGSS